MLLATPPSLTPQASLLRGLSDLATLRQRASGCQHRAAPSTLSIFKAQKGGWQEKKGQKNLDLSILLIQAQTQTILVLRAPTATPSRDPGQKPESSTLSKAATAGPCQTKGPWALRGSVGPWYCRHRHGVRFLRLMSFEGAIYPGLRPSPRRPQQR